MNLRFIKKSDEDFSGSYISFWVGYVKYTFEISTKDEEDHLMNLFEKEFKLNCEHQIKI